MVETIKSRYGVPRYIEKLNENAYLIYGNSNYIRSGENFIDYEGGPNISVGQQIFRDDKLRTVTSIVENPLEGKPNCYKIFLK